MAMSRVLSSRVLGATAAGQLALTAGSRRAATVTTAAAAVGGARGFRSSGSKAALKETRDMDKEDVEEEIEHHKQDQLKKKMDGKNHWTDELASESESIVWLVFSISARLRRAFFSISKPLGSLSANPSQYNHSLVSFLYHKVSDSKHRLRTQGVAARLTPRSRPVQVKADRTEAKSTADEIDRLQKHTTEKLSSKSKRETTDK